MAMLKSREAADRLGLTTQTLYKMRREGRGPAGWVKVGYGMVLYPEESIVAWLNGDRGDAARANYMHDLKTRVLAFVASAEGPVTMTQIRDHFNRHVPPIDRKDALDALRREGKIVEEMAKRNGRWVTTYRV